LCVNISRSQPMLAQNHTTIITPKNDWWKIDLNELFEFRNLSYAFAWREIKVRYKQTFLGVAWVVFQPLATMVIFTLFFGSLAKLPSGKLPYSLFVLVGLVYWNFFANVVSHASNSLIENENLIKKVYFPKLLLPLSSVLVGLVDFAINYVLLIGFSLSKGFIPPVSFSIVTLVSLFITIIAASGLGLFTSSLNIKFRDVRYILPFFIQILLFLSPVIYPSSIVSPAKKLILALNPMTGAIESVRQSISGENLDWATIGISGASAMGMFFVGLAYFKSTEKFIADIV